VGICQLESSTGPWVFLQEYFVNSPCPSFPINSAVGLGVALLGVTSFLALCLRRNRIASPTKEISASPPMTPPTIAPVLLDWDLEGPDSEDSPVGSSDWESVEEVDWEAVDEAEGEEGR
jgi:hypothetical protein